MPHASCKLRARSIRRESVQSHVRELVVEGTPIRVLNIDGLVKTKTNYREKDLHDKQVLTRIREELKHNPP